MEIGAAPNRRGTSISFTPDDKIFGGDAKFRSATLFRMARSKAFLFAGVEIRWRCDPSLLAKDDLTPVEASLHYPGGLADYLTDATTDKAVMISTPLLKLLNLMGKNSNGQSHGLGPAKTAFFRAIVTQYQPRRAELMKQASVKPLFVDCAVLVIWLAIKRRLISQLMMRWLEGL